MSAIDGTWDSVSKSPMGDQKGEMTLRAEDGKITGSSKTMMGVLPVEDGHIDGNDFEFSMSIEQPMKLDITVSGTIEGDTMTGKMSLGPMGEFPMTATRRSA